MYVVWFKKDGVWHCVEAFYKESADIAKTMLQSAGYEVADQLSFADHKTSVIFKGELSSVPGIIPVQCRTCTFTLGRK